MTIIWLVVWLLNSTPDVDFGNFGSNPWAISLVICLAIDLFGGSKL